MANKEVENQVDDKVVFETMPGADPISEEESKPFEVDMNFETPQDEEDEVEFPKEAEIEEVEQLKAEEEPAEELEEETQTEELEVEEQVAENSGEEELLGEHETDTQQPVEPTPQKLDKEPMIPKSRFDEVLAKQKALQKQLQEATNPVETVDKAPEYDFSTKEIEYQEHILNGEAEKAAALRAEIRDAERQTMLFEVQERMGQTVQQSTEAVALQNKAAELQAAFPQLDETSATYDAGLTQEVMDLRDAFMIQGFSGSDALEKAASYVVKPEPEVQAAPVVSQKVTQQKKVANTTKKLQAAESQPPALKGKNKVEKKVDVDLLSSDEFNALPDETLRRMRGDFG